MGGDRSSNTGLKLPSGQQPDSRIFRALVRSAVYRQFKRAFGELTGFRIMLLPAGVAPLSKRAVPICRAGQLVGFLQITPVESLELQSRRSLAAARLVEVFANHLELMSRQAALQVRNGEPPIIQRAKAYIQKHYATDLSLSSAAISLNVSKFYLCKLFGKVTGSTFSRYVSEVRVERARLLLLDQNLRVSEIAFDVGFQSLTHFNRAFRSGTGCSPTEYRKSPANPYLRIA